MDPLYKGFYLKKMVDLVNATKGPKGTEELRSILGEKIHVDAKKNYPMQYGSDIHDAIAQVIFGKNHPNPQFELGKLQLENYFKTPIGKIMLALMGKDIKKMMQGSQKIADTITKGTKVTCEELGGNRVRLRYENFYLSPKFFQGTFTAVIELCGKTGTVKANSLSENCCEFMLEWK